MSYKVLYNPALLINDMILSGDTLLNMSVNVKLFSNKINLKKIIFNTVYQYMTYSSIFLLFLLHFLLSVYSPFSDRVGLQIEIFIFFHFFKSLQSVYTTTCNLMNRAIITLNFYKQATR